MRLLWSMFIAGMVVAASASEAGEASLPGLHVQVRRPIVHRGGTIRARVDWVDFVYSYHGEFTARWQLRTQDGAVVAHGRRAVRLRFEDDSPYRFSVSARAPRSLDWTRLTLEVAIINDPSWYSAGDHYARGEANVSVQPGGTYWFQRESFTGTLVAGYGTRLDFADDPVVGELDLFGPGETAIRANPAWVGAAVTVTGRRFVGGGIFFPEDPGYLWVESVEWLDPLPERISVYGTVTGVVPARLPPPEILGEVNWARFVRESREPVVVESAGEMEALRDDLGTRFFGGLDPLAAFTGVDYSTHRVVVVLAGVSPDPAWFVRIESAHFDPVGIRFLVDYAVIAPADGTTLGFHWSEPYAALAVPRRDGPVEFRRHEWIPEPPAWW